MPANSSVGSTVGSAASYVVYPLNTRGIPYDVDPRKFYEYRAYQQEKLSDSWLETLVYDIFGPEFIGSLALAIDPFAQFKVSPIQVTPVNRKRTRVAITPRTGRKFSLRTTTVTSSNGATCLNPSEVLDMNPVQTFSSGALNPQEQIGSDVLDTTYRTRLPGSDFGEFEYFKPGLLDSGSTFAWRSQDFHSGLTLNCAGGKVVTQLSIDRADKVSHLDSNGRYSRANFTTLKNNESAYASSFMAKHAMAMLLRALPTSRSFSLYREIAELKDLPRTLRETLDTMSRLTSVSKMFQKSWPKLRLSDIPRITRTVREEAKRTGNSYLNSEFGWAPMFRALQSLILLPTRISKKVNRLIERNGKVSSWHSERKFILPIDSPPACTLNTPSGASSLGTIGTSGVREVKLRLAVSAKTTFPQVNVPYFKEHLLDEVWGTDPRLVDLYDLIPWTWLIDWFSDLGDYAHLMDVVNDDRTLINGGFLTYTSSGQITTQRTCTFHGSWSRRWFNPNWYTGQIDEDRTCTIGMSATFLYKKRRDLATILDVRTTSDLDSLSADQASILGALLTKFL